MTRPLLLIDVDGVLSLFSFDPGAPPRGRFVTVDGLPHYLSAQAGRHLIVLAEQFECVWCTGWEYRADEHLPGLLGLPGGWAHLAFAEVPTPLAHWKLTAIDAYSGPARPLAWIDDSHDVRCRRWAAERAARGGPTLLLTTDPAVGLTREHVEILLSWRPAG